MLLWLIVKLIIPYHHVETPLFLQWPCSQATWTIDTLCWRSFGTQIPTANRQPLLRLVTIPIPIYGCRWKMMEVSNFLLTLGYSWCFGVMKLLRKTHQYFNIAMEHSDAFCQIQKNITAIKYDQICTNTNVNRKSQLYVTFGQTNWHSPKAPGPAMASFAK